MNQEDVIRELRERYRQSDQSLNELQRRLWAAAEAMKLGRGGITIVSKALRIAPNTIRRGMQDIATGQLDSLTQANARIRKPGGGRKSKRATSGTTSNDANQESTLSDRLDEQRHGTSASTTDGEAIHVSEMRDRQDGPTVR